MKKEIIELRKLVADEGKTLTNGEVYSKEIYLGCNEKETTWYEIDDSEVPVEDEIEI